MADILSTVSIVLFVLAGVFLLLTITLGMKFSVWEIVGDLSGRTARKSIANIRTKNEKTGGKVYRSSSTNKERPPLTSRMSPAVEIKKETTTTTKQQYAETGILAENQAESLDEEGTTILKPENQEPSQGDETTILEECNSRFNQMAAVQGEIQMIEEIILIHTDEVI